LIQSISILSKDFEVETVADTKVKGSVTGAHTIAKEFGIENQWRTVIN
jgi:hypothetical protein